MCTVRCTCAADACSEARAPAKEVVAVCREGFFDVLIQEVASPSEKLPFKHLAVESLAEHLFQLGKHCSWPRCFADLRTVSTLLLIPGLGHCWESRTLVAMLCHGLSSLVCMQCED